MSRLSFSSRTAPTSGERSPTPSDSSADLPSIHQKLSSSSSSDSLEMHLLRRHRSRGGDEVTSRLTYPVIVIPHLVDDSLDELFPRRDPDGQEAFSYLADLKLGVRLGSAFISNIRF